jgi:hypothetical protein
MLLDTELSDSSSSFSDDMDVSFDTVFDLLDDDDDDDSMVATMNAPSVLR